MTAPTPFGTITHRGDRYDLSFERIYATTVDDVWDAVTNPERLARWMAPYRGELRLGGRWEVLDDALGVAPSAVVDPQRAPGISWSDRYTELEVAWRPRFAP